MIVVGTNIIGYLYLSSTGTEQAERVLLKDSERVTPLLWRSELRSVLAKDIHRGGLRREEAKQVIDEAQTLMVGWEYKVVSPDVFRLSAQSGLTAYE
ncbi:MAG: type II toxin-antitoxin system VapC family toxin [Candidatus Hadarchaeum sp.]